MMSTQVENAILAQLLQSNEKIVERMGDIEVQLAALSAQLTQVTDDQRARIADHEDRLRHVEHLLPDLVTRAEAEIRAKSVKTAAEDDARRRSARFYWIGGTVTAFAVPAWVLVLTRVWGS